jgi:uncharacterized membrane protein YdjX (TVP38/TMEM64 family)
MAALRGDLPEALSRPGSTAGDARLGHSSVVRLSAFIVLIAATVALGHLLNAWLDPLAALRGWVNRVGSAGPLLFVGLFLALNTLGVPLPVLGAAAGVAFGPIAGATIAWVAMTFTACAQFLLARHVVGARVRQRLGHRLVRMSQLLERRGLIAVAGLRLMPGPFSELNMLAGLTVLTLRDFTIGTIIGCAPKALAWSGIGALLSF